MTELLAPAGSYEGAIGAFHAGADAVYFGMQSHSARAFAKNFGDEEIVSLCRYARLKGKKTYLTLNTLMKEGEAEDALRALGNFHDAGLTGVIVQDLGLVRQIRERFPLLMLIASTQIAVTGVAGAKLLRERGVRRVVPARELTLREVERIRKEADIEVELFVHGAMCYSYSGMCLYSAMIGGRSGNRGRCAQACRMRYETEPRPSQSAARTAPPNGEPSEEEGKGGTGYLLSMKDLCTVEHIPAMIRAGVTSFKIEGRMKKSEYAAGVSAIYRKYMDLFLADPDAYGDVMPVEKADMALLNALYLRSERADGYLYRKNGKEMITVDSPAYNAVDEGLVRQIGEKYLQGPEKIPVAVRCVLKAGERGVVEMRPFDKLRDRSESRDRSEGRDCSVPKECVVVYGEVVQEAKSRPLTKERVREIMGQTGETFFEAKEVHVELEGDVFLPVKQLKELRNKVLRALTERMLQDAEVRVPGKEPTGQTDGVRTGDER